jgi:hypothetical protein
MTKKLHLHSLVVLILMGGTLFHNQLVTAQINFEQELFSEPVDKVIPEGYANTPGTATFLGPMANSQRTYQQLIAASQLTDLVDKEITSLSYRIPSNATGPWPTAEVTFASFDIYMSGSVDPVNRSLTFENNIVGPQTLVRSGTLVLPAESFPSGGSPNGFGPEIIFDSPWTYTGGNLLIEIRHTGFTGTSRSLDANNTSTFGYGTLYSACWTGNYQGTSGSQGNFCIVNLRAAAPLSVNEIDEQGFVMYPNPTNHTLFINSPVEVFETKIYALTGQLLLHKRHEVGQTQIEVGQLSPSTYVMEINYKGGVAFKKFIKN